MDFLFLEGKTPTTIKIYMAHIKSFFSFLYKQDLIEKDPTRKVPSIKVPKKEISYIPHEQIMKVLDSMFTNIRKRTKYKLIFRDYFIIRCAYVAGWRASEALGCEVKNIDWNTGEIYLPNRKGGKDGRVFLGKETADNLNSWHRSNYPNGKYLWYSNEGGRLSYQAYNAVFLKYLGKSSHRVRASLATYLVSQGVGIKDVADILGHDNVASTMKYAACIKTRIKDIHTKQNPFFKPEAEVRQ